MNIAETSNSLLDQAADTANQAANRAVSATQRGVEAARQGSQHLLEKAQRASDTTVNYIKDEPVKAILIAAATGAALMALVGLMARTRDRS